MSGQRVRRGVSAVAWMIAVVAIGVLISTMLRSTSEAIDYRDPWGRAEYTRLSCLRESILGTTTEADVLFVPRETHSVYEWQRLQELTSPERNVTLDRSQATVSLQIEKAPTDHDCGDLILEFDVLD